MNLFNIERAYRTKKERGWHTLYVAVDLHGTLIKPYHDKVEFYPDSVEVMKWFNRQTDILIIIWTSSYTKDIAEFRITCIKNGIHFDFLNSNPIEANSTRACFDQKFYFNILLDDKAGFEGETDWTLIKNELIGLGRWDI